MKTFKMIAITALLLVAIMSCNKKEDAPQEKVFSLSDTTLSHTEFATAKLSEVKNQMRFFGNIEAANNKVAQVYPVVGGVVKSIHTELGDYVKQGQVLASIQSTEIAGIQKERMDALSDQAIAKKNLQVAQDLYAGKLNSMQDVIAAQVELKKADSEVERLQEVYNIYHLGKGSMYNILAPISGFVLTRKINQNEQLRSDNSDPLFSIADINEVWALANVSESDISQIKVGYDADIKTLAFPDVKYTGKIDKIFNAIDPETKSIKVRVQIPNTDLKLKPDMNCTVTVNYSEDKQLVAVPSSSIIFDKNKYWVVVYKDKQNQEVRQVDIYRQVEDTTYLNSGVKDQETVVTTGRILIYDALNNN